MKRLVSTVVVLGLLASASPAFAASGSESKGSAAPVAATYDFSAKAAGIEALVLKDQSAARQARALSVAPARQAAPAKKSFWKTPWPYLIAGGAIIAGVLIANKGDGGAY